VIDWLGSVTGIYYPPILPIIIGIGMILIRLLKMDVDRSRSERQIRRLTQKLAILEQELRDAQDKREKVKLTEPVDSIATIQRTAGGR
jgi:sensor domain CHASE-containing protein